MFTLKQMFLTALVIIAKKQKQPKHPSTDECINSMWHSHTVEYHLAIKNNEVLLHATLWVGLKNIVLNERIRPQKITYFMLPCMYVKCPEQANQNSGNKRLRGERWEENRSRGWGHSLQEFSSERKKNSKLPGRSRRG